MTCEHILAGNDCPPIQIVDADDLGLCCGCPNGLVRNKEGVCVHPDQCKCGNRQPGVPYIVPGNYKLMIFKH